MLSNIVKRFIVLLCPMNFQFGFEPLNLSKRVNVPPSVKIRHFHPFKLINI